MPSRFQPTRWSLIHHVAALESAERERAWEEFDHLYREPLLRFIQRSGWPPERTEDLLQSFLAKLAERHWLAEADPEQGRMRTFLLGRLKHHLSDARKHDLALKRGGDADIVSLDAGSVPEVPAAGEAEEQFDREWAQSILDHTLAGLREQAERKGKREVYALLKHQITGDSEEGIREAAERLGQTEGAIRMQLQRLREQFRLLLRKEVAETLLPEEDVSEEMRYLARVLGE